MIRPRRNRKSSAIRDLVRETVLIPSDFIFPVFIIDGKNKKETIESMPGIFRLSIDNALRECQRISSLGIRGAALFPALPDSKKDKKATESKNPDGLLQQAIKAIKHKVPDLQLFTDVAMDPYSSDGQDGFVENGKILNDPTIEILADMAVSQAQAGTDWVAPSDMMDGRVGFIRDALDEKGFQDVGILSYSVKYASAFYGPFRDALDSVPKVGDKKTYQMDPANVREADREVILDIEEGADMVMIKPAGAYLDVIRAVSEISDVPVAAYQVSGEFAMIKAAAQKGWLNEKEIMLESLMGIKRAGADIILSYFAPDAVAVLE